MANKPYHEIRLGKIRATVWANGSPDEQAWFRVSVSRLYKDGDEWRDTQSFRREDLPILSKAIDMTHSWLCEHVVGDMPEEEEVEPASTASRAHIGNGVRYEKHGGDRRVVPKGTNTGKPEDQKYDQSGGSIRRPRSSSQR